MKRTFEKLAVFPLCRRGVASIEFVAVLPIMIFLMFASVELWSFINLRGRLTDATSTLADLVSSTPRTNVLGIVTDVTSSQISYLFRAYDIITGNSQASAQVVVIGGNPDYCDPSLSQTLLLNCINNNPNADLTNDIIVKWIEVSGNSNRNLSCGAYKSTGPAITNELGSSFGFNSVGLASNQDYVFVIGRVEYRSQLSGLIGNTRLKRLAVTAVRNLDGILDGPLFHGNRGCNR